MFVIWCYMVCTWFVCDCIELLNDSFMMCKWWLWANHQFLGYENDDDANHQFYHCENDNCDFKKYIIICKWWLW